jgi:hypothetical protein
VYGLRKAASGDIATLHLRQRCASMAEYADVLRPTAERYRERAKLVRMQAAAMRSRLRREELLDVAQQYEDLADNVERALLISRSCSRPSIWK